MGKKGVMVEGEDKRIDETPLTHIGIWLYKRRNPDVTETGTVLTGGMGI